MCYQSGPLAKTQLSGRIHGLQVDLDPCWPWYRGSKLASLKHKQIQPTEQRGADVN